jgi:hypothetical protein
VKAGNVLVFLFRLYPYLKGRRPFIDREAVGKLCANYSYIHEGIYMTSGLRLEMVGS